MAIAGVAKSRVQLSPQKARQNIKRWEKAVKDMGPQKREPLSHGRIMAENAIAERDIAATQRIMGL